MYFECQLVSIWNAALYYSLFVPKRYGQDYQDHCKASCAVHEGALSTYLLSNKLGLYFHLVNCSWSQVIKNIPCEFSVFCKRGYHSTLAVGVNKKNKKVLLTNYAKNRTYWISWKTLRKKQNKHKKIKAWKKMEVGD